MTGRQDGFIAHFGQLTQTFDNGLARGKHQGVFDKTLIWVLLSHGKLAGKDGKKGLHVIEGDEGYETGAKERQVDSSVGRSSCADLSFLSFALQFCRIHWCYGTCGKRII